MQNTLERGDILFVKAHLRPANNSEVPLFVTGKIGMGK